MAAPDVTQVHYTTGALIVAPTNLTGPDYGGTRLGIIDSCRLTPITRNFFITAEEYGGETVDEVYLGRDWILTCTVRGYDNDSLDTLFPNTADGSSSTKTVISEPGGLLAGSTNSGRAVKLLFAPEDSTQPGFLFYRAMPQLRRAVNIDFRLNRETAFLTHWRGIRDASGRVIQIGRVEDLTVS